MPVRPPSELKQLNDGISFPIVGSLNVRVDDIHGLFTTQSGIGSGIGYRGYKNLDEVLAQLSSGSGSSPTASMSGVEVQYNGGGLGNITKLNFSGVDVTVQRFTNTGLVIIDPSINLLEDGVFVSRVKSINFSGSAFQTSEQNGVGTIISQQVEVASGINVQDEGSDVGRYVTMNFSGAGVTAQHDGTKVTVIIPQGVSAPTTSGVQISEDGVNIGNYLKLNFSGAGVTAIQDGDTAQIIIPQSGGSPSASSGITIRDDNVHIGLTSILNFSGAGVNAVLEGDKVTVIVAGGGGEPASNAFAYYMGARG